MPNVRTIRMMADDVLDVEWIRIRQIPGVSPPEWEQESLVERYTVPPGATWEAQTGKKDKEEHHG